MLSRLNRLWRATSAGADDADRAAAPAPRINADALPSTQDAIAVVAAQDDVLILRNSSVVAGVGFGSMDDALLSEVDLEARLGAYRDLLKTIQFDFQLLIGTRPQNLGAYQAKMQRNIERLAGLQERVDRLTVRLPAYLAARDAADAADAGSDFTQHFGFAPGDLFGVPGGAHEVALALCDPRVMAVWPKAPPEVQRSEKARLVQQCEDSLARLAHWQAIVAARADTVEMAVEALQAPVRTFTFLASFNPRLLNPIRRGALEAGELERARKELDRRCAQLSAGLREMRLPHWRATHDELLADIRHFYHPAHSQLHHDLSADRSVAMRLASVVR
jgi:hypothetical protein